ncbi:MAG: dTMP kinase [Armatimonadota bacterium]
MPGVFITIEGIDGSGKTTQTHLLVAWLLGLGYNVCATREPGGTSAGERIREVVLSREWPIPAEAELFLYLADRSIHVSQLLRPALAAGDVVVCERYSDSTIAYQGYGRGLDRGFLTRLNEVATGGLVPDLTLVLDVPADRALRQAQHRLAKRLRGHFDQRGAAARLDEGRLDRLESEGQQFLTRVAAGFGEIARAEPGRVKMVDGSGAVGEVHSAMVAEVQRLLAARSAGETRREGVR